MNLNLPAYGIFLTIVVYIILVVGKICYRNGNIYVMELLQGHEELCIRLNKILLLGYYIVNIGYAAISMISWEPITSITGIVEAIAIKTSVIVGILSLLHYLNIILLTKYVHKLIH